jgi:hypothetical protein
MTRIHYECNACGGMYDEPTCPTCPAIRGTRPQPATTTDARSREIGRAHV